MNWPTDPPEFVVEFLVRLHWLLGLLLLLLYL